MTDTELLEEKINDSGFKKKYIAEKIGIAPYSLAKKINNITEFKTSEIHMLCTLLKINSLEDREKIFFAVK